MKTILAIAGILGLLALSGFLAYERTTLVDQLLTSQAEVTRLEQDLSTSRARLSGAQGNIATAQRRADGLEERLGLVECRLDGTRYSIAEMEAYITDGLLRGTVWGDNVPLYGWLLYADADATYFVSDEYLVGVVLWDGGEGACVTSL